MIQELLRTVPVRIPVNPFRLETFARDVSHALQVRRSELAARNHVRALGLDQEIDEGRFPKGTCEHGMYLSHLAAQLHPEIVTAKYVMEDEVNHGIVTIMPARALKDIQLALRKADNLKEKVVRFLDDGIQKVDLP